MVELLPVFADEARLNLGRAPGGLAVTPSGRSVPVRTAYADLATSWSLEVAVEGGRLVRASSGRPLRTAGGYAGLRGWDTGRPVDRFLYTMDLAGQVYACDPTALSPDARAWSEGRQGLTEIRVWHHSSFVAGAPVTCAGDLRTDDDGRLVRVSSWSGHYRPGPAALATALRTLREQGVDLGEVDAEVVQGDGSVRIVDAAALADLGSDLSLPDRCPEVRRRDAIELVCRVLGATWTAAAEARLDRWVAAGLRSADRARFDPRDPVHWNWLVRWSLEGSEPQS